MERPSIIFILFLLIIQGCSIQGSRYDGITNFYSTIGESIICFGDSLTAGEGAEKGKDYPSVIAQALKVPVINAGRSGDTTASAMERLDKALEQSPKIVIVELGANDYLTSFKGGFAEADESDIKAFQNLKIIVNKAQNAGAVVIIVGIRLNRKYTDGYKKLAKETGSVLIPDILDGILGNQSLMSADNRHPNAKGYQKMADKIIAVIAPLLKEIQSFH